MYCKYCLKNQGKKIELIRFSDAYSCPSCYLVSNEIVFGSQTHNYNTFFSHDCNNWSNNGLINSIKNCEKLNTEIENACIFLKIN